MTMQERHSDTPARPPRRIWRSLLIGLGLLLVLAGAFAAGAAVMYHLGPRRAAAVPTPPESALPGTRQDLRIFRPQAGAVVAADQRVNVDSEITGGVEARAVVVNQGGRVGGPLTARDTVQVNGEVVGDVNARVAEIGGDTHGHRASILGSVRAGTVIIHRMAAVTGPVAAQETAEIAGSVTGNVEARQVILRSSATVTGDLTVTGGRLVLEPGAVVNGTLRGAEAGLALNMPEGAGSRTSPVAPTPPVPPSPQVQRVFIDRHDGWGFGLLGLAGVLGLISMTAIARVFAPAQVEEVMTALEERPRRSLITGLWTALLVMPATALLAATIIGIPLAAALAATVAVGLVGSVTAVSGVSGGRLLSALGKEAQPPLVNTSVGAAGFGLLVFVPILGWLIIGTAVVAGFGAFTALWYPRGQEAWRNWRQRKTPAS